MIVNYPHSFLRCQKGKMCPYQRREKLWVANRRLLLPCVHLMMMPQPLCGVIYPAGNLLGTYTSVGAGDHLD